jgi:O-antigen/teichoic acid export membrane protein
MNALSSQVLRSGAWSLAGNWLIRCLGVVKMMILARILSPQDFGVTSVALLALNCLGVFSEIGVESALIQKKEIDREDLDTAWTMTILRGVFLCGAMAVVAGPVAAYFANADLKPVLQIIAICFVLEGFTNIGIVFFQRTIDFKQKVKLDVISDLAGTIAAVLLALFLKDFWALVWASILWRAVYCWLSFRMHAYRPKICWVPAKAGELIHFGKHVFWISVVTFLVTNGDNALVGRLLGLDLLGYYAMAYSIANLPVTGLAGIIGKISFPAYARFQDDRRGLQEAFRKVLESTLMLLLPLMALIGLLAEDFILLFLGAAWMPMAGVLQVLCLLGLFRGLSNILAPLHLATSQPEIQSRNKTLELLLFSLLIYPLTERWGLIGAGWAVSLVYFMSFVLNAWATGRIVPRFGPLMLKASVRPAVATAGLAATAWFINMSSQEMEPFLRFAASGSAGVVIFAVTLGLIYRKMIWNFYREAFQ